MADRSAQRRRVGLRKSFSAAVGTARESDGPSMTSDAIGVVIFTLKWWVSGVPVEVLEREDIR